MKVYCKATGDNDKVRSSTGTKIIESEAILHCCDQRLVTLARHSLSLDNADPETLDIDICR